MPKVRRKPAPDRDAFIQRLKTCEAQAGNQNALARKAKISQSTIRSYTARATEPPRDILIQLARAAGVSPLWLITGEGSMESELTVVSQPIESTNLDAGIKAIAAATATKYAVPVEFALSRLTGSEELYALEQAMLEWRHSRPIPVVGCSGDRIWGVLSQDSIEAAAPSSMLKDIQVYQMRTGNLKPDFLAGDWALIDCSEANTYAIENGTYCVTPISGSDVEVRDIKRTIGKIQTSHSRDSDVFGQTHDFSDEQALKVNFTIIGRLVGAMRFVSYDQPRRS